ncbi:coatomer subunit delta [[Candida] jaroonii]|uniref:Coatomer subunit delta n=1 Tax=[Candida] jaroonii TaxID=467808 RepID=A0ACA9YC55_9ASCO|nr:coatomer subunit delta [[Candida] jaroonii]
MVVLASSICTRGGKPLLSRQFKDLSKDTITQLLANFPSLISSSNQHTTVENENVRYVYQPLEEFYIVLITNKQSNILQDIDTLHLFQLTIGNLLRNVDEREIFDKSFEILSSFDEIINNGYKENLTLQQVETFLEMDSHEEKIQEIIEKNKEMEAIEERKRKAKEIQRKELARKNLENQYGNSPMGMGGMGGMSMNQMPMNQMAGMNMSGQNINPEPEEPSYKQFTPRSGGLQLGKKPQTSNQSSQPLLSQSQPIFQNSQSHTPSGFNTKQSTPQPTVAKVQNNGILITINEKFNANLNRDGSILSSEIKGDLQLRINNSELSNCKILLKNEQSKAVQFKTHPNVDRNLFQEESVIGLKDKSKNFPNNDQSLGVLRWRCVGNKDDDSFIPILFTAWVNINDNIADITLEYELTSNFINNNVSNTEIKDIKILVPSNEVSLKDEDNLSLEMTDMGTLINIDSISIDDPQGSFEFQVNSFDEDSLFPMNVKFDINYEDFNDSDNCFGKIQILDVVNYDDESLPFDLHCNLSSENYQIS